MQIVEKKVEELQPYENNPRKNERAVQYVKNSIEEFGFKVPIVVDRGGVIVAGHTRYLAALELGMETVPTVVADDLSPEQVKAFRIADNKTSEKSSWDFTLLAEELDGLELDMTEFGFNEAELLELTIDESDIALFTPTVERTEVPPTDIPIIGIPRDEAESYAERAETLVSKRVIIVYRTDEDEKFLKKTLGLTDDEPLGVVYDVERLKA